MHCRPDGTPFYVGKGTERRVRHFGPRNAYYKNIVAKYGTRNLLVGALECSSAEAAYELEAGLIKCLRRSGVALCNLTAGGDGGRSPAEETRKRLSEAAKKRGVSEACHAARVKAKTGVSPSAEQRAKQSAAMIGKKFTDEHRRNISIGAKKRGMLPATLEAAHAALRNRVQSEEEKTKRSEAFVKTMYARGLVRAVRVGGVEYPSIVLACKAIGSSPSAMVQALKRGGRTKGLVVEYVP